MVGFKGMYMNKWSLDFNRNVDIPNVVLVKVKLPRLSLYFLRDDCH